MSVKIGINGFGRIGKLVFRHSFTNPHIDTIVVNDLMPLPTLAYLLKYDTVHGNFNRHVEMLDDHKIRVDDKLIHCYAEPDPENIPWEKHGVSYVVESSGRFSSKTLLQKHLRDNILRVILTCPPADTIDRNIVIGVNENTLLPSDRLISNTSCTTNCVAPVLKILDNTFGINRAFMNTVHPYTNNQSIMDAPHADLRRSRAAAANIIPTTSTAIKAVINLFPHLKDRFDGLATRVPVIDGALIELCVLLKNNTSVLELNNLMKKYADESLRGILAYTSDPIVSSDIINNPHSVIFDSLSTKVLGADMAQLILWYDNEFAYSLRVADLILLLGAQDKLL